MNRHANSISRSILPATRGVVAIVLVALGPVAHAQAPGTAPRAAAPAAAAPAAPQAAPAPAPTLAPPPALADRADKPRPRIGLVLSGGGARGLTHVGVLHVLEQMRIPIDYIAATSMGSIVGGLYASGMSSAELEKQVRSMDWPLMFSDRPPRQDLSIRRKEYLAQYPLPIELGIRDNQVHVFRGAISGANLELWLHDRTRQDDTLGSFDELPIPFRAVATDMVTGQQMVFRSGPLYEAIRASMSVPGLFAPVTIGDHIYGDGGLVNNLPVDVVQAMGADIVIAINIGTPLMSKAQLQSIVGFTSQSLNILTEQNVRAQLARLRSGDVLIEPDLGDLTFLDFEKGDQFIALGEEAARRAADKLAPLSLSPAAYAQYQVERRQSPAATTPRIDYVKIEGTNHVNPAAIAHVVDDNIGKPFSVDRVSSQISDLYGSGDFDSIEYRLVDEQHRAGLQFQIGENSLGPNYLRFGLNLSTDLQGESQFNVVAGTKSTWLNRWGLEWTNELELGSVRRFTSELYQPLGPGSPWFASLYGQVKREPIYIFQANGSRLAEYSLLTTPAGLDLGYAFSPYAEVRVGFSHNQYRADLQIGDPAFPNESVKENGVAVLARYDQLDNPYFPRTGLRAELAGFYGQQNDSMDFVSGKVGRGRVEVLQAIPVTKESQLLLGGRVALSSQDDLSFADDYQLGGFLNLSGLKLDQLYGPYVGLARAEYLYKMGQLSFIGRDWYVGASAEIGNAWQKRSDVSFGNTIKAGALFVGLDTFLGPFYVAYGRATGGSSSWYIFLGRP
ncbi:MAG: patatin-like phospholipase family protein [Proteobacteria bacterium]|nr:patatin-like phospholipase family protein [Pseudomonadota bacterium]